MPYSTIDDLSKSVKNHLPKHALEIYREAFNHAWREYSSPSKRRGNASQEEVAHQVAWAAVKRKYHKDALTDKWVKNA
jgi:cation transport regulator